MNIHVGLNVTNLSNSVKFYSKLFEAEPVKVKENYAKFLIPHLSLNFTLNVRPTVEGNHINHFGIQVERPEEILKHKERLIEQGNDTRDEINTVCCYAKQDKFWVNDPDGHEWEFFFTWEDTEQEKDSNQCCI
ncbi:ArsI/CadI family heavy metal resistance metalloenzyme [Alkalihalobacterium elongatum]|uniref:ArsI/CadI family heavy metal resistance metalloenzyme n=1 Tax=Alkalihalobacterium elongatum TaxID=2675466 RepID=UPI001C1FC61C|nr:ArsI/CadI family heavy metal resistance metalloenzyme [Alkalihalobacterium elongatum]